tara:strand:- start:126 stop:338 length:213 start_codon:yes stop_codon:yes gene_type:complete
MVKKRNIGNCYFEYIEEYDTEENAAKGERGSFVEVKVGKLTFVRALITKEKSDGTENPFAKAERPTAKET